MNSKTSRINEIKEKIPKIDKQQLVSSGKCVFDSRFISEFKDSIGPDLNLEEYYTAYLHNRKLVLECYSKFCDTKNPDTVQESDYEKRKDYIYITDNNIHEVSIDFSEGYTENGAIYHEILSTIELVNTKEKFQKQPIRSFFRKLFAPKHPALSSGELPDWTIGEISQKLEAVQQEQAKTQQKEGKNNLQKYAISKDELHSIIRPVATPVKKTQKDVDRTR